MSQFKTIGIAGEGKMGSSIFYTLSDLDYHLVWLCSSESWREKTEKIFLKKMKRFMDCGGLTETAFAALKQRHRITARMGDLVKCDLIIEAVTEDAGIKRELFRSLDNEVQPECIFATNSSSVVPSLLVPSDQRKEKVAGLHFFYPVSVKSTVELIAGRDTSLRTIELLRRFILEINKKPFIQDESNAFIMNRIWLDYQAAAFNMVIRGDTAVGELDGWIRQSLFPIGVFEFFDHVGIDIMLQAIKTYTHDEPIKPFYIPMIQKLEQMAAAGHLGIKSRKGFYDYPATVLPDENDAIKSLRNDIGQRLVDELWDYYINAAHAIIDSGVCSPEDLSEYIADTMGMETDPFSRKRGN